jgi:hypothetical protein
MSSIDSLKEAKRGIGVRCQCGKSARITARGQTLCYECFDENMGYVLLTLPVTLTDECANGSANLIECDVPRSERSIDEA